MAIVPPYRTKAEKIAIISQCKFAHHKEEVDDLLQRFEGEDPKGFFFRGMSKASYKLYTSGQRFRILHDLGARGNDHRSMYTNMLHRTRNIRNGAVAELMKSSGIHHHDDIALFSYMQHHSGPTPFLDLTEDPFVALYFAVEGEHLTRAENELDLYFSVYSVPRELEAVFNGAWKKTRDVWMAENAIESTMMASYAVLWQGKILIMREGWIRETFGDDVGHIRNNLNVINQKGLFVFNGSADLPLIEAVQEHERQTNAASVPGRLASNEFRCINIHNSLAGYVRERLAQRTPPIVKSYIYPSTDDIFRDVKDEFIADLA